VERLWRIEKNANISLATAISRRRVLTAVTTANKLRSTDSNATTVNASMKVRAVYLRLIATNV
jgi:hypothetical protein